MFCAAAMAKCCIIKAVLPRCRITQLGTRDRNRLETLSSGDDDQFYIETPLTCPVVNNQKCPVCFDPNVLQMHCRKWVTAWRKCGGFCGGFNARLLSRRLGETTSSYEQIKDLSWTLVPGINVCHNLCHRVNSVESTCKMGGTSYWGGGIKKTPPSFVCVISSMPHCTHW